MWDDACGAIDQLLEDYNYEKTLTQLLAEPANSVNVTIMVPQRGERYRLDVFLDIGLPMGSHVFGAEFSELTQVDASATF